ncbi:MAG: metal-sulfur cluster assembly factor [Bdellovibrionota bacterium]
MPTKEEIIEALKTIEDPELFLDIWFLGLIYGIGVDEDLNEVDIEMTFTTPACPAAPSLVEEVHTKVGALPDVKKVNVNITFTPPWEPSDDVKAMLGMI